jgi:uncharacterized membrane protein YebE (DUF533 family)
MSKSLVQIILLAAVADGEIQEAEKLLLQFYKNRNPRFLELPQKIFDDAPIELFNKVKAGIKISHLIEDIGEGLSAAEKEIAYALTYEICAAHEDVSKEENEILDQMKKSWKLKSSIVNAVELSAKLRFMT